MIPFQATPLDRASEKRTDAAWIAARRKDPTSYILPMWKQQPFLFQQGEKLEAGLVKPGLCESLAGLDATWIFLGLEKDRAMFALDISAAKNPAEEGPLAGLGLFKDLRMAAPLLPDGDIAICSQAKAMLHWHETHGYCAKCGAKSHLAEAGYKRECGECKAEHFPRTDPVSIMLVTHGDECLLGRSPHFAAGFYSTLAGFIEPGETIEAAVAREVMEEAGVKVKNVRYFTGQPWPFPSSLMIGCFAEAEGKDLTVDKKELEDARWFTKTEIREYLAGKGPVRMPGHIAIAHHLIKAWAEEG